MFGWQSNHKPEVSDYVRNPWDTIEEVHEHAREHLWAAQKCQKDHYDQRIAGEQIKVGNRVFLHDPAVKKGQTKKLHSPWQGPCVVITRIGNVTYHIQAVDNPRKRKVLHFNHLKLCGVPNWWISSTVLTRLLAQRRTLQCKDRMFHPLMFLMKLISCTWMKRSYVTKSCSAREKKGSRSL